ncbi:MAG: relaxase domain-containing protein [Alphaproteobacteria bacterium]|nr:relaxase domain-containing protein [Alphaproteobacteria bacterium]
MLSVASLTQGPGYYLELANINYYAEGGEPVPLWYGTAAQEFGLSGIAERHHVERLCAGYHHETQRPLVRNAGTPHRNPGHDLTFSCPKSVSVAWAMADTALRKAIEVQHLYAVREALDFIEAQAGFARVGKQGQELVKSPLLFALFEHGTSRASDPQLHTHALCINLTVHPDGRITAIDSTHLYHWKMSAGAIYRAALARGLQELGFMVEQRQVGASLGFELADIPLALVEEFSKRRAEIERELTLRAGGLDAASPRYAELIAKETRRRKDSEKPRQELLAEWKEVGKSFGIDAEILQSLRYDYRRLMPEELEATKRSIFREALSKLSEQHAHWNEAELLKTVAELAVGRLSSDEIRKLVKRELDGPDLIRLGILTTEGRNSHSNRYVDRTEVRYTTPEVQRLEQQLLRHVERIVRGPQSGTGHDIIREAVHAPGRTLDDEQKRAVEWLCSGPGIRLMSGLAGTGKTYTLKACHDVWRNEGRDVWGCAVAAAAAKRLQEGTGIESQTIDRLLRLLDADSVRLHAHSVIVVDEAGMVGTKQIARLVEHVANAPGARIILVGDSKQLQPITAGGPFKYLSEILGEVRLDNIRRQEELWAREAVRDFERGRSSEALAAYVQHDRLHLANNRPQAISQLIDQWKADGGIAQPENVFMLASLNSEVKELNLKAQAERIRSGHVDANTVLHVNGYDFHPGDRIQFQKNSRELGVLNSDTGTVLSVDPKRERLTVRLDQGEREIAVSLKRYSSKNLRLGYGSTTHKAQGASIPFVHVLMGGPLTDLHMGYVQASRSQKGTHIFCDRETAGLELKELVRALGRERQKTLAQEITDRTPSPRPLGPSIAA